MAAVGWRVFSALPCFRNMDLADRVLTLVAMMQMICAW